MQTIAGDHAPSHSPLSAGRQISPRHVRVNPDWSGPRTAFRHTWEGIVNVDQFRWLVRRDMQEQLELAHRELGATHVRAVGMFDDEMRVFCESPGAFMGHEPKAPRTNWQTVDYVIDSLADRGLQPMFTTTFIPSALASGPTTVFTTKAHTSPPKDWGQWEAFVRESVQHCVDRYSLETVRTWPFEVWNEPNLQGWFWGGDQSAFFRLWEATYRAVKSVDASLRIGGPSTARAEWLEEFINHTRRKNCPADYLITHIYNNDSAADHPLAPFDPEAASRGSKSPTFAMDLMRGVRGLLRRCNFQGELHWNEWGRSFHAVDYHREHPSEAAFIARLLGDVSQEADVLSYWCLSDIYDQVGYGREAFFGGYGLLNLQGLRKPAYHAFQLMHRLGTERVAVSGDNLDATCHAIVTRTGHRGHVLVYAAALDDDQTRRSVEVTVQLPAGAEHNALYRIDSLENNVIAQWEELGKPAYLSREQTRDLAARNNLQASSNPVRLENVGANRVARFTMESPGLALLEVTFPR
jgi:xylan 1,4-beta-xylosidase